MANFGTEIEKKVKQAAADGEPQWDDAGLKVGLQVWRIEQFKVVKWPKSKYGKFHRGDSYIILSTYVENPEVNPDKLAYDVHFWIGDESTQDEYGTAAYKTVELDDKLRGLPVQHREVQGHESDLFLGYFPGKQLTYLAGGVDSGFRHVEGTEEQREPMLFQVKGRAGNILLTQVDLKRSAMNSGDVFILDSPDGLYQWNGSGSNAHERSKAAQFCTALKSDRGSVTAVTFTEGQDDDEKGAAAPFWKHLPGERTFLGLKVADIKVKTNDKGGDDKEVKAFTPTLYRIDVGMYQAKGVLTRVARMPPGKPATISKLKSSGAYLVDDGFHVHLWVGKGAPKILKAYSFPCAQQYLKSYKRPPVLPITKHNEGRETKEFLAFFGPAQEQACCIIA
eukprot:CAMPEP_0115852206 /NCGR_PEP_ID=MMETSP0287-20121206/12877_1 /TAXON_ID=412157 /ORGANISM="Chrysochromulina rotalis, Strain UIO044" /LENGTH=392 /DNA_ID=CAMNT_0003306261 /DNA_START=78 /DNA_END=1256 /DNA_ORIENTATION=-